VPAQTDDTTPPYRLPTNVLPNAYRLVLVPDQQAATFAGDVEIDVTIEAATRDIVLNAAELDITFVELNAADPDHGWARSPDRVDMDVEEERATLVFGDDLPPGPATLHLAFNGVLNDMLRGFYRSTFTDDSGHEHTIATTQMESTDARRAFPCWDEPAFKATFEITLVVEDGLTAWSNSPAVEETPEPGGRRRVRFAPTMVMSTYLVAFIVGPLEATDPEDVDGVPLRVVHPVGKGHLTGYALEIGRHALRFFTGYFGIPYPAEKLDLVAIPDFAFGAMENLGCVTFRESVLLIDPDRSSRTELERVADVVCHEIAHMWFGDLVTMRWWNGIWLNEAFATFMEILAVDAFRPEWQRWVSFGVEREAALSVDGLFSTRPVEFPVGRPEEADGMFDVLTYQKGGSVLRMLEQFLAPETFRDGVRDYLSTHAYGNTETADLWDALERSSGRDVRGIMTTWIDQGGYPLVRVGDDGTLAQAPFSYRGEPGGAIGSNWQVPVLVRALDGDGTGSGDTEPVLLESASDRTDSPPSALRLANAGGSGYYRVAYSSGDLRRLAGRLPDLLPLERYNLTSDSWAAVLSGDGSLGDFLHLARSLVSGEEDPSVWSVVTGAVALFDRVAGDEGRLAVAAAVRQLFGPLLERLGFDPRPDDGERTPALRASVVRTLGVLGGDDAVRAEAVGHFARSETTPLDPDTAAAVLDVVADSGGPEEYDTMLARYRKPANPQEENRYLYALASFTDHSLAARTFDLALSEFRTQSAPFVVQLLLANRIVGAGTWSRVRDNWETVTGRFPSNTVPRMLDGVRGLCTPPSLADEVTAFLTAHPLTSGGRTVEQTLERLAVNVEFGRRHGPRLPSVLDEILGRPGADG